MAGGAAPWASARLEACRLALADNGFEAFVVRGRDEALDLLRREILGRGPVRTASWGDSMTAAALGVIDALRRAPGVECTETFDPAASRPEIMERRRRALLCDLFVTGTNAVTEDGKLVNLDMVGNRVAGLMFGPRRVLVCAGRNKITPDTAAAMKRIKALAAPMNALRHGLRTPCVKTGKCRDCKSAERICNTWSILEKCHPQGRIAVMLADRDLGL